MSKEWKTKGLFPNRIPNPDLYDMGYFSGDKAHLDIQYPADGSYLNPESDYQYKFKDMLSWISGFLSQGTILDIGSGPGHLSYWSQKLQLPYSIINSDVSYEILKFSQEQNKNTPVVNNAANLLPFKPSSFDGILFSDILLHLWPEDAFQAVKQASILIKDNGFIFIKIGNRQSLTSFVRKEQDHIWLPTVSEMENLLSATDFNPNSISSFTRGFPFSKTYRQLTGNDLRLPFGGSSIFIAAQKLESN